MRRPFWPLPREVGYLAGRTGVPTRFDILQWEQSQIHKGLFWFDLCFAT